MLDEAQTQHPGVEYAITVSAAEMLRLPLDARELLRIVDGRAGSYSAHVYRDSMVTGVPDLFDWLVVVNPMFGASPAAEEAVTFYGDLRSGSISTTAHGDDTR